MKQEEYRHTTTMQEQETPPSFASSPMPAQGRQKQSSLFVQLWKQAGRWLQTSTFSPHILRGPLAHPVAGYLIACLSQVCALAIVVWLVQLWPNMHFREALPLLAILLVALGWGTGPSIAATLMGTLIIMLLWLPSPFLFATTSIEDSIGVSIYLGVGLMIGVLTSQVQRARYHAEMLFGNLSAMLDAIPDAITTYDSQGRFSQMNRHAREKVPPKQRASLNEITNTLHMRTLQGKPLTHEQLPLARALRGEIVNSFEMVYYDQDEQQNRYVAVSAAPWRNTRGAIAGVVTVTRDHSALRNAERAATERASMMEAIFSTMTDAVMVFDLEGNVLHINPVARAFFEEAAAEDISSLSFQERVARVTYHDEYDNPLTIEQMPTMRILQGEQLTGKQAMLLRVTTATKEEKWMQTTGAPISTPHGQRLGAVVILHDETEQRALEQRTRKALQALLAMARTVVLHPFRKEDLSPEQRLETLQHTVQQLADLAQPVLNNKRMSISLVEQPTEHNVPLAATGLTPEEMQRWRSELSVSSIHNYLTPTLLNQLQAGEVLVLDLVSQPPIDREYYGFGLTLAVPLLSGNNLIGLFAIDNGQRQHTYTEDEIAVAHAVAQLATLVIEREQLEVEHTKASASVLALQETNHLMNEFLSIAAHEIRTPLTTIKTSLQLSQRQLRRLLDEDNAFPNPLKSRMTIMYDLLERAERQASRQTRLVRDLMDVSRIQANRLALHPTHFNLTTLLNDVISDQRAQVPNRTIRLALPEEDLTVLADQDRIEQVIDNYLSNALKYSEANKPVQVQLEPTENNHVHIQVHDEGPGLAPEEQQRIWERFYRVPNIEVMSGSGIGLGLGLHISRTIVELHGGQVGLQSTPGHGSTFWFTLPLAEN